MRVLVFSHLFPRAQYPVLGRFVEDQVVALEASGVSTRVVTVQFHRLRLLRPWGFFRAIYQGLIVGVLKPLDSTQGLQVFEIQCPAPRLGGGVQSLIYALCVLRARRRIRDEGPYSCLHAHTGLLDGVAATAYSIWSGLPFVLTEHTGPYRSLFRGIAAKRLTQLALKRASLVVAVSSSLATEMQRHFPWVKKKLQVIPNTFSPSEFHPRDVQPEPLVCGWLGHISKVKRVGFLLEAFQKIHSLCPGAKLKLITLSDWPEEYADFLRHSNLEKSVLAVRSQTRSEVAHELSSLSLLLVTSEIETFSVACLEALAVGTPVVSTDCGGPRDIILGQRDGLIVESKLAAEFGERAAKILLAPQEPPHERQERARRALDRFGPGPVSDQYISCYRQLSQSGRSE